MPEQILSAEKQRAEKPFPWRCPKCRQPTVTRVTMPYRCQRTHNGRVVTMEVPNLAVPRCSHCGEVVFDYTADEQIRSAFQAHFGPAETAMSEGQNHRSERAGAIQEQGRSAKIQRGKRVLVYKRTHNGDPDQNGCFGAEDCMGIVRARDFDAVIGVGGIGSEAHANGIAGQINWIGIGPHKTTKPGYRGPVVTFDHFLNFGTEGPDFRCLAPTLAERMYANNIRHVMDGLREEEYQEVLKILRLAEDEPPSPGQAESSVQAGRERRCVGSRRNKRCGRQIG